MTFSSHGRIIMRSFLLTHCLSDLLSFRNLLR